MLDCLVPGVLPPVVTKSVLLVQAGHQGRIRLDHLPGLVQPCLDIFLKRTESFHLDCRDRICQIHIARVDLPCRKKLLFCAVYHLLVPIALPEVIVDRVGVVADVLLPLEHVHGRIVISFAIVCKALERGYRRVVRILFKEPACQSKSPVIVLAADHYVRRLGNYAFIPWPEDKGPAVIP